MSARRELEDTEKEKLVEVGFWVERKEPEGYKNSLLYETEKNLQFNSGAIVCMKLLRWRVNILLFHLHKQPTGSYQLDAEDRPKNQTMWSLHRF